MKKLILLLITLLTFTNVSYASFPITDTLEVKKDTIQTEEIKQYHYSLQQMDVDLNSCKCVSCRAGIAPLVSKPKSLPIKTKNVKEVEKREPNGNLFAFLSVLSALGAIVFAFLTLGNAMSHNGNHLPYLLLTLIAIASTVYSTIKAKNNGAKWGKAFLGVGVLGIGLLLFLILLGL
tara:strand:+ start:35987 stop:36517 length:531 start_codon:yes stop_codon:yes gene_type:complete